MESNFTTCIRGKTCFDIDNLTPVTEAPLATIVITIDLKTELITEAKTEVKTEEKIELLSERATIEKHFEFSKQNFAQIEKFSDLIEKYFYENKKELKSHVYEGGIIFITANKYGDFILTVYPIHKEDYLYRKCH